MSVIFHSNSSDPNQAAFTVRAAKKSGTVAFCTSKSICNGVQYNSTLPYHTNLNVLMAANLSSPAQQWTQVSYHYMNGLTGQCAQAHPVNGDLGYGIIDTMPCNISSLGQQWSVLITFDY